MDLLFLMADDPVFRCSRLVSASGQTMECPGSVALGVQFERQMMEVSAWVSPSTRGEIMLNWQALESWESISCYEGRGGFRPVTKNADT